MYFCLLCDCISFIYLLELLCKLEHVTCRLHDGRLVLALRGERLWEYRELYECEVEHGFGA